MLNAQVKTNGTTIAMTMPITNTAMDCGTIEINPGKPPTPMADACTLFSARKMLPNPEPTKAAYNGNLKRKFTPNIAGSVMPK